MRLLLTICPIFMLYVFGSILRAEQVANHVEKYKNHDHNDSKKEKKGEYFPYLRRQGQMVGVEDGLEYGKHEKTSEDSTEKDYNTTTDATTHPSIRVTNNVEHNCPEGLTYYKQFTGTPFCYVLTKAQTFPPVCPYQNYLEYDSIRTISNKFYNQSMWIKAKRDTASGFGQFEWLYPTNRYMELMRNYENPTDNILERNCLIQQAEDKPGIPNKLVPVSCDEKYPVLCVYSYSYKVVGKYCSKRNEFTSCISTSLNLDNKCYCQAHVEGMQAPRSAFCQKLAEPMDPFQNHMLLTELTNKSPCWFGIEYNGDGGFQWSYSNESMQYTYWKENVDPSKRYGALDYAKPKGWILEDDYALKCAICETEVAYQNVTLRLVYIPSANNLDTKIELRIQNVYDIHNYFILQYIVACFTDSNTNDLRMKVLSMLSDLITISTPNYTKTITVNNYYPSYYWCEAFQRPNLTRIYSNKILVYKDTGKHGHEYALTVTVPVKEGEDPYLQNLHVTAAEYVNNSLFRETTLINTVRPMKVLELSQTDQHMKLLLHMSIGRSDLSSKEEHQMLLYFLEKLPKTPAPLISGILNFLRSEVCLENTTTSGNIKLHWPETNIGTIALPKELCLLQDSTPVTRKCEGSFMYGGVWGEVQGECATNANISKRTVVLYELLNSEQSSTDLGNNLCEVTKHKENVLVVDVHFMADILEKLSKFDDGNITIVAYTLTNIMEFDEDILKKAQIQLNSTDRILHVLDMISAKVGLDKAEDYVTVRSRKLIIQISDLTASNVTGLAIQRITFKNQYEAFLSKPLYNNVTIEDLLQDDIDVAVFLPQKHVQEIQKCMENQTEIKLAIAFFSKNVLFNEIAENGMQETSRIISVFVPGSTCRFETPIPMVFKSLQSGSEFNCGHWNYGKDELMENIHGSWENDSIPEISTNVTTFAICQYSHTTHFALLVFNENFKDEISEETVLALNIITAIGCGLSLIGLAGIFVTAIAFKSWRNRARNIIMLNFSLALAAQMILLFVADNTRENSLACLISGASLYYTVLSEFAWMLIVAFLQYRKFVAVFQKPIPYLILKCLIIGWCLPLIPVAVLLAVFPESYKRNHWGLCYPEGKYFYFGVALPVGLIILINLFVFVKILLNICHRKVQAYGSKDNDTKLQVLLAILLFFLLGMSWFFGLAATFFGWVMFSYLFCLTATLQGFVIFVFFIVMNKTSRLLWLNIKKICFCTEVRKRIY